MRVQILCVDARTGSGLVAGDDGRRYIFGPDDWVQHGEPSHGQTVDFEAMDDRALNIFPLPVAASVTAAAAAVPANDRNRYVAATPAFFIGTLGIHRFYPGRTGSGVAMLVLTRTVIGLLVTGLWALIDAIRYLMMSDAEFAARYQRHA